MFTESNKQEVIVAKSITKATLTTTPNPSDAAVQDGEVLVMGYNGATMKEEVIIASAGATIAKYPKIRIVTKIGANTDKTQNDLLYSSWIDGRYVSQYRGVTYSAGQEQIYVIGYNGTSGSIDVTADTQFITRVEYKHDHVMWAEQHLNRPYVYVSPTSTPVQSLIAADLMRQINNDAATMVKAEMLSADAGTAIGAAADTVVGQAGSKSLVITDTGSDSSVIALSAGDFIRMGTAVTAPVYRIAAGSSLAVTGGTVTLESPLQAAVNLVGNTCEYITAAQAAAAAAGVKITGLPNLWQLDTFPFVKTRFNIGLVGFGTTTTTDTQQAKRGTGVYQLVAEHEWQAKGNRGALNRERFPFPGVNSVTQVSSSSTYDCVYIAHANVKPDTVEGLRAQPIQLYIYFVDADTQWTGGAGSNNPTIKAILDTWFASTMGAFPAVVLT